MKDIIIFFFGALIIIGIITIILKAIDVSKNETGIDETSEEKDIDTSNGTAEENNEYPYVKTFLLTKREWGFYKQLKPITDKYNLHILSKVRLLDLVDVKKGLSNKQRTIAMNKIKSKHIDFVIANPANLAIYCLIELDDKSHNRIDRQQRDYIIDKICETVKLPIIHCTDISTVEDELCEKLKINNK